MRNRVPTRWLPLWSRRRSPSGVSAVSATRRVRWERSGATGGTGQFRLQASRARHSRHDAAVPGTGAAGEGCVSSRRRRPRELEARLGELSEGLRGGRARVSAVLTSLLAQEFRGAPLLPADEPASNESALQVQRAAALPRRRDARRSRLCRRSPASHSRPAGHHRRRVPDHLARCRWHGRAAVAAPHDGPLRPGRQRHDDASCRARRRVGDRPGGGPHPRWQIVRWTALSHVVSRAKRPVFTEITDAALGGNESFQRQLGIDLDTWMATIDSVLTRDSNGHHGVSVGDVDGDGLDDLYVTQPAGLPNRLYRNRGDSTFEDITDRAGLGVLDDTASSLFADVDNDGDEDLVLATATTPLLFINDGKGHFTRAADAFQFARPPQGVLTSMSSADYDRDGYVDLYLCVYSYFFGAGEDKAGTPAPYYDARNGPPGILLRNDGHGHFVDVTTRGRARRGKRSLSLRRGLGRLRRRRLARSPGRERLRDEEPVPQPRIAERPRDLRGRRSGGRRARSRRGNERHVLRLRQRRPARHLHRQHVERAGPAGHVGTGVPAGCDAGGAGAVPATRARQLAVPQPRRRAFRRCHCRRRARRWDAGPGPPTRSTSTATAGKTSTSSTAC